MFVRKGDVKMRVPLDSNDDEKAQRQTRHENQPYATNSISTAPKHLQYFSPHMAEEMAGI